MDWIQNFDYTEIVFYKVEDTDQPDAVKPNGEDCSVKVPEHVIFEQLDHKEENKNFHWDPHDHVVCKELTTIFMSPMAGNTTTTRGKAWETGISLLYHRFDSLERIW